MIDPKRFPNTARLVKKLLERKTITARSITRPHPLSDDCLQNVEDHVLERQDFVWLLRAREAEIARGERRQRRGR